MTDETSDERRRGDRIPINQEFSGDGSTWVSDLSGGGVFVHTDELLPVGSAIELRFTVLVEDPVVIEALGKVVRHSRNPPGMGVEFQDIQPDMLQRIETVLDRHQPLDSGTPLRLPEVGKARHEVADVAAIGEDDATKLMTRRAVDELTVKLASEDAKTASFTRLERDEQRATASQSQTGMFQPPPKAEADEDDATKQYEALRRKP